MLPLGSTTLDSTSPNPPVASAATIPKLVITYSGRVPSTTVTTIQFIWISSFCGTLFALRQLFDFYEERFSTPTFHPEDPSRYIDEMKQQLGLIAELLHFIPACYHGQLQSSKVFAHMFCKQIQGDVFGSTPSARAARQNCHLFGMGILGWRLQLHSSTPFVLQFCIGILTKIARIIIYGPARFRDENVTPQSNSVFSSKDLPIRVTSGMVAWCAIIAIYLLSGDGDFSRSGIGNYSNINYKEYFANYKQMIIAARGSAWHAEGNSGSEGNNVDSQVNSPEEARRLALGNELSELLQQLTTSEAGHTIPEANANGAAPRAMTSVDENVNSNDEGPGSGNSGNLIVAPIYHSGERQSTSVSQPRPAPRPSITDTEPDVPTASNLPWGTLRRTYSFIDEPSADTPPLFSQLAAPTPLQCSHSESNMHTASEPTPFVPQSLQPPSGDVLASGSSNEIPPSHSARANLPGP
ncbi:hypothetical protein CPB84DRAFT_1856570 [Gymnopilus junonius]|uniref:Uncharacterized protein n=1 Tax=Gymnopilus junonius TaxID=109634 RepID=A0A9P5TEI7_GYMJU|nr:hypothetical protein CPB84DRAFT_1856570 [Gymnopilus junonius]